MISLREMEMGNTTAPVEAHHGNVSLILTVKLLGGKELKLKNELCRELRGQIVATITQNNPFLIRPEFAKPSGVKAPH